VSDDSLLNSAQVRALAGNISVMCLWRWQRDPRVQFPPPDIIITKRNYWRAGTIKGWLGRMQAASRTPAAPTVGPAAKAVAQAA
jgi:hypothetical protein